MYVYNYVQYLLARAQQASLSSHLNCVTIIPEIYAWLK